ncbi:DUF6268 family outer membrane beta-barrel protein [Luteolibacter sp. AS25]|uniref:DUF6268 family outer membrane beta-barrel protein n=1 Tax=Luteolibacter sp. AS25 TaxID=3135776 RepID=UPI00398B759A
MFIKPLLGSVCVSALLSTAAHSGEQMSVAEPEILKAETRFDLPPFDLGRISFLQTGDMDFEGSDGDLSLTTYGFRSFFTEPIELAEGLVYIPMLSYYATSLNFDDADAFPLHDEDLHAVSLHSFFIKTFRNSPWFGTAWNRVEFATDYQSPGSDSLTFDGAIGVGYKFNDNLSIALGGAVTGINGDVEFFPGINFDWKATENLRMGLYGPNFLATYTVTEKWNLSVRGEPTGGNWVFRDDDGKSRTIDLSSYGLGLYTEHNLYGNLWLTAGGGYTFGNEIERRSNGGGNSITSDLDGAPYMQIALGLRRW